MSKNITDLIIKKLTEYEIEVLAIEEGSIQFSSGFLVIEKNEVTISFHVSTTPDFSAIFVLIISEITQIKKIYISELFTIHESDILYGKDAVKKWEVDNANGIIKDFIKQQELTHFLITTNNCGNS